MKLKNKQTIIYKISTSHFKKHNWQIEIDFKTAMFRDELITIGDSQFLRALFEYAKEENITKKITEIEHGKYISDFVTLYDSNKYRFTNAIINLSVDSNKSYDIATNKGIWINNVKYVEYIGTTGGVKSSNVFYIREDLFDWAWNRLNNNRNLKKEFIPNKLQAYLALDMSVSNLVSQPNKYVVVNDVFTNYKDSVIELGIDENESPFEKIIDDYGIELDATDGFGLISPRFANVWAKDLGLEYTPSVFIIRNSFCKGALVTFDFVDYASKKNSYNYNIIDLWGNKQNLYDADFVLTESMLKLWSSYDNIDEYNYACLKNNHKFCITKIQKNNLDNERMLNYQFIQPMELDDSDIKKISDPTINFIKDVISEDYFKRILFLAGENLELEKIHDIPNDFVKALMISEKMMFDPYIINKTKKMIYKKMQEAKFGKLKVDGNFTIISGDPYALCQNMFSHTVTGLLKANELYMKYWSDKNVDEVCALRAPMSSINNIKKLKIVSNDEMKYWYKHMDNCSIINSWDTTSHTLNGLDFDGDLLFTTNNDVFMRNIPNSKSVVCIQSSGVKKIPTQKDFHEANKKGFSNKIGSITNKGATMYDLKSLFEKENEEYNELSKRIRYIQLYQQMEIDALKGIKVSEMPKEWYNRKYISETNSFDESILADKKPYFMIYIYNNLMVKYNKHINKYNSISFRMFGISLEELIQKENKSTQEQDICDKYYKYMPVSDNNGVMNKICKYIEKQFKDISISETTNFDSSILKSEEEYTDTQFREIKNKYSEYRKYLNEHIKNFNINDKDSKDQFNKDKKIAISNFKKECQSICKSKKVLANILVDVCYNSDSNKEFCWLLAGKELINNLARNTGNTITCLIKDEDGEVHFNGNRFYPCELEFKQ